MTETRRAHPAAGAPKPHPPAPLASPRGGAAGATDGPSEATRTNTSGYGLGFGVSGSYVAQIACPPFAIRTSISPA